MLRVGYPATILPEMLSAFPSDVELVPISDKMERDVEIDVWVPDPYSKGAMLAWPHLRGVKLVLAMMAGTEWIPAVVGPHVTVCNAQGAHNISTAEWTLTAILASLKYFPRYFDIQNSTRWTRRFEVSKHYAAITGDKRAIYPPVLQEELTGRSVLLIGYGAIGKEIERMLEPFRVDLIRIARKPRTEPEVHPVEELESLLPKAQVVILIVPSTADTRHLINASRLALMQQGALLVNAARGSIIETDALVAALQGGKIRAAVDVTDPEPLPPEHPLWSCPNLLLTPHVGGSTPQFSPRALATAAAELRRYMKSEPLHNVVQAAI